MQLDTPRTSNISNMQLDTSGLGASNGTFLALYSYWHQLNVESTFFKPNRSRRQDSNPAFYRQNKLTSL